MWERNSLLVSSKNVATLFKVPSRTQKRRRGEKLVCKSFVCLLRKENSERMTPGYWPWLHLSKLELLGSLLQPPLNVRMVLAS